MNGSRCQGRSSAVGAVKGPSPGRPATTRMRRKQTPHTTPGSDRHGRTHIGDSEFAPITDRLAPAAQSTQSCAGGFRESLMARPLPRRKVASRGLPYVPRTLTSPRDAARHFLIWVTERSYDLVGRVLVNAQQRATDVSGARFLPKRLRHGNRSQIRRGKDAGTTSNPRQFPP